MRFMPHLDELLKFQEGSLKQVKNTKLIIVSVLVAMTAIFFTTSCTSMFKRTPANANKPIHYIVTLHGVRGNEKSYGQFHELVKEHLEKIDPGFVVVPLNLTYKTAQFDYTPKKAAQEINMKLDEQIKELRPEDKISVVAYSMGGQVGVAWYYNSLEDDAHRKYPMQTENFISLGAAYWGAMEPALITNDIDTLKHTIKGVILEMNALSQKLAEDYIGDLAANSLAQTQSVINNRALFPSIDKMTSVEQIKDFYDKKKIKEYYRYDLGGALDLNEKLRNLRNSSLRDIAKISFAELEALSIAGPTVEELRLAMMAHKTSTRWTSISTLVQCFETDMGSQSPGCNDFQLKSFAALNKSFAKYSFGYTRRETDNAVITPSSVAQFLYVSDQNKQYNEGALTAASDFKYSIDPAQHKVIFAETLHATLVTEDVYTKALGYLGKLGQSWTRLADDVVIVHKDKCETPDKCDHPVYKYVLDELANCGRADSTCDMSEYNDLVKKFQKSESVEKQIQDTLKSELHGFTLELNLRLPYGYDLSKITDANIFNSIKMDFSDPKARILKSESSSPVEVHIGRSLELGSILVKKMKYSNEMQLKVNFTGLIIPKDSKAQYDFKALQNGTKVNFTVNLPNIKSRKVEALVSPYHSTYVDLAMAAK
jgi:hypothetical protein